MLALALLALVLTARGRKPPLYDPRLVREKLETMGYVVTLRLFALGSLQSKDATHKARVQLRSRLQARLSHLASAYGPYTLASGNSFQAKAVIQDPRRLPGGRRLPWRAPQILNSRELAALWHLPAADAEIAWLERGAARHLPPLPAQVASGCRIGESLYHGKQIPVHLSDWALGRNLLLVAKTGKGKSTLMEHLFAHLLQTRALGGKPVIPILIEPHGDLAAAALTLVPQRIAGRVVCVDAADLDYPVPLNFLDVRLWPRRDKAISNVVDIFSRVWERFWGARMEDVLRYALETLWEANLRFVQAGEADRQYTLLDVVPLLTLKKFRSTLLPTIADGGVRLWWRTQFDGLTPLFLEQVTRPVQSKFNRFARTALIANILGQPTARLDLRAILREERPLVVNLAAGTVGEDIAALLGAILLGLVELSLRELGSLPPEQRPRVVIFLDEFQVIAAANYTRLLGELRKFGASFVLATQSISRLKEVDPALRAVLFSNIDTLCAFQVSAEDAEYLAREYDSTISPTDLITLPEQHLYVKTGTGQGRLPVFSCRTLPPPSGSAAVAEEIRQRCRQEYGVPRREVEERLWEVTEGYLRDCGLTRPGGEEEQSGSDMPATGTFPAGGVSLTGQAGKERAGENTAGTSPAGDRNSQTSPRQPPRKARRRQGRNPAQWSADPLPQGAVPNQLESGESTR